MNREFWKTQTWALFATKRWFYLTVFHLTSANRKKQNKERCVLMWDIRLDV
jgi:hypothetical protein